MPEYKVVKVLKNHDPLFDPDFVAENARRELGKCEQIETANLAVILLTGLDKGDLFAYRVEKPQSYDYDSFDRNDI